MRAAWALLLAAAVALGAAGGARAELARVESVGSVPLGAGAAGGATARQAAVEAGVRDAVERAAQELATQAGSKASPDAIHTALGDPLALASRYRILEDRGERAPLLEQGPGAQREYVVTVEAYVDRDRLRTRLEKAGLLGPPAPPTGRHALRIAFAGIESYPLWERIERALGARGGAVRPLEFGRDRIVAEVETDEEAGAVIGRLGAALGEAHEVRAVGSDGDTLLVAVAVRAAPEPAPEAPPVLTAPPGAPAPTPAAR
jgi:hypothetical protein